MKSRQRYIYKLKSSDIKAAGCDYKTGFTFVQGLKENKIISIGESQLTDFVDRLTGKSNLSEEIFDLQAKVKRLRKLENTQQTKSEVSRIYKNIQKKKTMSDILFVIMASNSDYMRMNRGFKVDGVNYRRLLSTTGGIKDATIMYCNVVIYDKLNLLLENGCNLDVPYVPAKYEAYKSLVCSTSTPLLSPNGVLVVEDCYTKFKENVLLVSDDIGDEPTIAEVKDYDVELNVSDGFGLATPTLMGRWGGNLNVVSLSGVCLRNFGCKGMIYPFDFHKFSREVAKEEYVVDVWGNTHSINDIELILPVSMLKLWKSYSSIEHYLSCCAVNGYSFRCTKTFNGQVGMEKRTNYQFLQSLELTDVDILDLVEQPIKDIDGILQRDINKTLLYLCGGGMNKNNYFKNKEPYILALMAEKQILKDPFIRSKLKKMIKKRIDELKCGKIPIRSNFMPLSGDPYSLCQSIFEQDITGLMPKGRAYSSFWYDLDVARVSCFRAPMSCHNNIRVLELEKWDYAREWYQYMDGVFILNSWDSAMIALNGADFDGDLVYSTDNPIILKSIKYSLALICPQRVSEKKIVTEKDIISSNISTFGNKIGQITNRITAMENLKSNFRENSLEWEELDYRIKCGQLYQQNEIDRAKGVVSKPMAKKWYEKRSLDEGDLFNHSIVANKRPYFMIYSNKRYRNTYNEYVKNKNSTFQRMYGVDFSERENLSVDTTKFTNDYFDYFPVFNGDGVINRLCRIVEEKVLHLNDDYSLDSDFDRNILKCGVDYTSRDLESIKKIVKEYWKYYDKIILASKKNEEDVEVLSGKLISLCDIYKGFIFSINCNEREVCDILVDICYNSHKAKQFVWDVCGWQILDNILKRNEYKVSYPVLCADGDIQYGGRTFVVEEGGIDVVCCSGGDGSCRFTSVKTT